VAKKEGDVAGYRMGDRKLPIAECFVENRADANHLRLHVEIKGFVQKLGDIVG